jgi:hypothetical protein
MQIAEIEKNQTEKILVSLEHYRGATFVDLRVYWQNQQGEWKPSRKGIALTGTCIGEVIKALNEANMKLEEYEIDQAMQEAAQWGK